MTKKILIAAILCVAMASYSNNSHSQGRLVSETYIVKTGDTLWKISEQFIQKNTYGPRDIREFYHGILENNQELFSGRQPSDIYPGDKLTVNYWTR